MSLEQLLKEALKAQGRDLAASGEELRLFVAQETLALALLVGQAGYDLALVAAAEKVAAKVGLLAIASAAAADERLRGIIIGWIARSAVLLATA